MRTGQRAADPSGVCRLSQVLGPVSRFRLALGMFLQVDGGTDAAA